MPTIAQQKGSQRDRQILNLIEQCQALNTDQITALIFEGSDRKARERLLKLYKRKRVNRCRYSLTEPYCYYTGKKHGRLEHLLDLNWVYVWLVGGLKSWEQIVSFDYEVPCKSNQERILQTDAFCGIKNAITGRHRFYYIELDRSYNDFDKVIKYNQYYESEGYTGQWWADLADRFPAVLVVTTTARRAARIQERIKKENSSNLDFKVMLLSEIKGGKSL